MEEIHTKKCTKCQETFPATDEYFYKQKTKKGNITLSPWCKKCKIEYQRGWENDNKEQYLIKKREWRLKNKELVNERAKLWQKENSEEWKEYYKSWQQSDIGKEKMKESARNKSQLRTHNITKKEWVECKRYFNYTCAYCGMPEEAHKKIFKQQLHKEHYIHNGSNGIENCIPSCLPCNSKKHTDNGDNWYAEGNPVYSEQRKMKINEWILARST